MRGVLYIVATPIGNLDDITYRAVRLLKEVNLIAAEDTRHSLKLLNHLGITNKLISLHDFNEQERKHTLVERLLKGEDIALISDAGTPLISDPGYHLVKAAREASIKVSPVPGPSSIMAALCAAGLATNEFIFMGFLSQKNTERLTKLAQIAHHTQTTILLESTHRIIRLIEQINATMPETKIVIAKEITKTYEQFIEGKASDCLATFENNEALAKGEFVVMIEAQKITDTDEDNEKLEPLLKTLLEDLPLKKAVKIAVDLTGLKKNKVYTLALELKSN